MDRYFKKGIREIDLVVMNRSSTVLIHVVSCRSIVMTKPRKQKKFIGTDTLKNGDCSYQSVDKTG